MPDHHFELIIYTTEGGGKKADKYIAWELHVTAVSSLFSVARAVFWEVEKGMEQEYRTTYTTHS